MNKGFNVVAAQVVLPEPAGYLVLRQEAPIVGSEIKINRLIYTKNEPIGIHEKLYTEQQVRALLARVSAPAQAASGELIESVDAWFAKNTGLGGCSDKDVAELAAIFAAPQAQVDARDAAPTPPAQERKPLTDEQMRSLILDDLFPHGITQGDLSLITAVIRHAERAHGIGA